MIQSMQFGAYTIGKLRPDTDSAAITDLQAYAEHFQAVRFGIVEVGDDRFFYSVHCKPERANSMAIMMEGYAPGQKPVLDESDAMPNRSIPSLIRKYFYPEV